LSDLVIRARQAHGDVAAAGAGTPRLTWAPPCHRSQAEVARFFDGLDMAEPGLVPVQEWRPRSEAEAGARSAMRGGVGRKR
jgi:S-adenosyl methyltransferase